MEFPGSQSELAPSSWQSLRISTIRQVLFSHVVIQSTLSWYIAIGWWLNYNVYPLSSNMKGIWYLNDIIISLGYDDLHYDIVWKYFLYYWLF